MDKKILLINPPYDINRYMGGLGKVGWIFPPIGLLYIASFVREKGPYPRVKIYDFQVERTDFSQTLKAFDPDIVGITCQSALVYSTLKVAKDIKGFNPDIRIIVGGVHASIRPQDLLSSNDIDIVVHGEGEETFMEVCNSLKANGSLEKIKGISYKDASRKTYRTPARPMALDLDKFPMPALDLLPLERYRISPDMRTGERLGVILTARGCPYNCMFCANKLLTRRTYRARSIKSVIEEIEYYLANHLVNQLMIYDDNFAVNRARTMELCDEFIRRDYPKKFNWFAQARVDNLDEELLMKMRQAGCSIISLGLESGNQRLLDLVNKGVTISRIEDTVRLIKKSGIKSRASFILGLPTETREESLNTIKFAYSLPIDQIRVALATPFPGTKLWDIAVKEGKIDPDNIDWTRLSLMGGYAEYDPPYYPEGRSGSEIKKLQRRANLFFFFRPRIMLGFLGRVRSFSDLKHLANGVIHFVKASVRRDR